MEPKAYSYIRFSTPEQAKGDSLRRQTELAEKYCREHGLTLDTSLRMADEGLSAYKGEHRVKGAFGEFLRHIEAGRIAPGSVLLIEQFDRISREQAMDAFDLFRTIIKAGIRVVTLQDGKQYDVGSLAQNPFDLFKPFLSMILAHEESEKKSERVAAAWANKRERARNGEIKMTSVAPDWLELVGNEFKAVPERAQIVSQIFDWKLAGIGFPTIEKRLNQQDVLWKPKNGWQAYYVNTILRNEAVCGVYQPCTVVNKKRVPIGEPIADYYPAIVSRETFARMQKMFRRNVEVRGNCGGRTGQIRNLFTHLVKCSFCGSPMAYVNKGARPKEGREYLICDKARRGIGCKRESLRYDHFEPLILLYCKGLDATDILPGNVERQSELSTLRNQLQAIDGDLLQLESKISNALDAIVSTDSRELRKALQDRADKMLADKAVLEERRKEVQSQLEALVTAGQDTERQLQSISELLEYMRQAEGQERVDVRASLREQLRRLIRQIRIDPVRGSFAIFFHTGERRLLTLEKGLVFDAYPKRAEE